MTVSSSGGNCSRKEIWIQRKQSAIGANTTDLTMLRLTEGFLAIVRVVPSIFARREVTVEEEPTRPVFVSQLAFWSPPASSASEIRDERLD